MTNKKNQEIRNREKWKESEKQGTDMSGYMSYCEFCENAKSCQAKVYNFGEINANFLCAKAYNRMKKRKINEY